MKAIVSIIISILVVSAMSARAADAKANWAANCAQCHGADGSANTPMGKKIQAKNLTDPKVQAEFTDAKAMQLIKKCTAFCNRGQAICLDREYLIQNAAVLQCHGSGCRIF